MLFINGESYIENGENTVETASTFSFYNGTQLFLPLNSSQDPDYYLAGLVQVQTGNTQDISVLPYLVKGMLYLEACLFLNINSSLFDQNYMVETGYLEQRASIAFLASFYGEVTVSNTIIKNYVGWNNSFVNGQGYLQNVSTSYCKFQIAELQSSLALASSSLSSM